MEDNSRLDFLIRLYLSGRLSQEEYRELWTLLENHPEELLPDTAFEDLWVKSRSFTSNISDREWDEKMQLAMSRGASVMSAVKVVHAGDRGIRLRRIVAAAIMVGIIISTVFYFIKDDEHVMPDMAQKSNAREILPGGNKAVLTLSDGSSIDLGNAGNGKLANDGNTEILKKEDGRLDYQHAGQYQASIAFNTLQTPRGGQYQITLSDGSKVWLNAASSMRYPVRFSDQERRVEISGEAYFDIAKDSKRPFIVKINDMEVQVLGTQFNINGYQDESGIRTTLLEGAVQVTASGEEKKITPGQQAVYQKGQKLHISNEVNLEETVAWKDGHFQFENSDIRSVMRQLSRWYDMDVRYEGEVKKHFIGGISREVNLSKVLSMLEQTGEVSFNIEGRTIIVKP